MPPRSIELADATIQVFPDVASACHAAAQRIADVVADSVAARGKAVLGLATGKTPLPVYARLVELYRAGLITFDHVSTYNLDEYYPIAPTDPQSYRSYMDRALFHEMDIPPNRTHLFDGTVPESFVADHAAQYDGWIEAEGGLDFQLLGIGRNGHIGFNEPTSLSIAEAANLPSRLMDLHPTTLEDAAADFDSPSAVPRRALTLGTMPILAARSILVLAFGRGKAGIVARALTGPETAEVPATLLRQARGQVAWMLDESAASELA